MSVLETIKTRYYSLAIHDKIIAITTFIFIIQLIFERFFPAFFAVFRLTHQVSDLYRPWMFFTYAFFHNPMNPIHILLNMLVLHFVGNYVINLFKERHFLNIYILGILSGAIFFFIGAQFAFPLVGSRSLPYVLGASGAIRAVIFFLVAYNPNMEVMIFRFRIQLKYIGLVLLVIDLYNFFGNNTGGALTHYGGTLIGILYAYQLKQGKNLGSGLERLYDKTTALFKKKSPLKTVHNSRFKDAKPKTKTFQQKKDQQAKIDAILDKISKSGYESLSKAEKKFLFDSGKE